MKMQLQELNYSVYVSNLNKGQYLFQIGALVAKAGYFVLAAQLAFAAQPIVEGTSRHYMQADRLQYHILISLGFVVAI